MHMHASHQVAPDGFLVGHLEVFVALAGGRELRLPDCEGVGGGRDHGGALVGGRVDCKPAGLAQRLVHLAYRTAHAGVRFDLCAQHFRHDLVRSGMCVAVLEYSRVRIGEHVAGIGIDKEELLLDTERDRKVSVLHGCLAAVSHCATKRA